ncbi:hypothetical protein F511_31077 [Dorcoceras hygrometricum]|uniref:Uncharacterized protein n=1 Tax=Dorcoceras hygrometricum TaxID=472368 RepID=A0A2Z7BLY1_9LAMI|nr:hypothetical protein F511_31077 [Dorcoceras hygrometricum]
MRLPLSLSAHRILHINSPVQILPVGHIFPAVDKSSEKVLAWLYFVSFAFNASAGFVDFEHVRTVQLAVELLYFSSSSSLLTLYQLASNSVSARFRCRIIIRPGSTSMGICKASKIVFALGFALNHCSCTLHLICALSCSALHLSALELCSSFSALDLRAAPTQNW